MKAITLIISLFLLSGGIYMLFWMIKQYGKRDMANEKQYEMDYYIIKTRIDNLPVNKFNFESIDLRLSNLKRLPFKNPEKTEILVNSFYQKYGRIRIEKHLNGN